MTTDHAITKHHRNKVGTQLSSRDLRVGQKRRRVVLEEADLKPATGSELSNRYPETNQEDKSKSPQGALLLEVNLKNHVIDIPSSTVASSDSLSSRRKEQVFLSLEKKLEISQRLKKCERRHDLAEEYNVSYVSIYRIAKSEKLIREQATRGENLKSKVKKTSKLQNVETELNGWIQEELEKGECLTRTQIKNKAKIFAKTLNINFKCSKTWERRWKTSMNFEFNKDDVLIKMSQLCDVQQNSKFCEKTVKEEEMDNYYDDMNSSDAIIDKIDIKSESLTEQFCIQTPEMFKDTHIENWQQGEGKVNTEEECELKPFVVKNVYKNYTFKCDKCNKIFTTKGRLMQHLATHNGYTCKFCNRVFKTYQSLYYHKETHVQTKSFVCGFGSCNEIFSTKRRLIIHKRSHFPEECICNVCGAQLCHKYALKNHIRTHTGEKPFSCNICDQRFISSSSLWEHKGTHSTIPSHVCNLCEKSFKNRQALYRHKKVCE